MFFTMSPISRRLRGVSRGPKDHDFGFVQQILTFIRVQEASLTSITDRLNTHLPYCVCPHEVWPIVSQRGGASKAYPCLPWRLYDYLVVK